MGRRSTALGCAALLSVVAGSAHATSFLNLVDPLNPTFTQALGINGSGVVVGYGNASIFNGFQVARPFTAGSFTRENFPGAAGGTQVIGIDGAGDTVGFYVNGDGSNHGFFKPAGGAFTTVDRPGTAFNQLLGINQSGTEIAGYSSTDVTGATLQMAFSLAGGVYTDINGLLPANFNSQATGVNDGGTVVGFYHNDTTGDFSAFEDVGGTVTSFQAPGSISTQALGINDLNEIVGTYVARNGNSYGFLDNGGISQPLIRSARLRSLPTASTTPATSSGSTRTGRVTRSASSPACRSRQRWYLLGSGLAGLALVRRRRA